MPRFRYSQRDLYCQWKALWIHNCKRVKTTALLPQTQVLALESLGLPGKGPQEMQCDFSGMKPACLAKQPEEFTFG